MHSINKIKIAIKARIIPAAKIINTNKAKYIRKNVVFILSFLSIKDSPLDLFLGDY